MVLSPQCVRMASQRGVTVIRPHCVWAIKSNTDAMTYLIDRHHALRRICPTTWCSEFTWAQFHNHSSPSSLLGSINVYSNKKDGSRDEPALNAAFTGKFIYFPTDVSHSICYGDFTFWPETKHAFLGRTLFLFSFWECLEVKCCVMQSIMYGRPFIKCLFD